MSVICTTLLSALPRAARRKDLAAAIDLAISFHSCRLTNGAAAGMMATTLACIGGHR